jgi:hypothetical protein
MAILSVLLSALLLINSSALHTTAMIVRAPDNLDIFNPRITSPTADTTWYVGSTQNITWRTSDIPPQNLDNPGRVLLGHILDDSENLNTSRHALVIAVACVDGDDTNYIYCSFSPCNCVFPPSRLREDRRSKFALSQRLHCCS